MRLPERVHSTLVWHSSSCYSTGTGLPASISHLTSCGFLGADIFPEVAIDQPLLQSGREDESAKKLCRECHMFSILKNTSTPLLFTSDGIIGFTTTQYDTTGRGEISALCVYGTQMTLLPLPDIYSSGKKSCNILIWKVHLLDKYYPLNHAGNGLMVVFVCVVYLNVSSFISGGLYAALQSTLPEITTKAYKVHLPYKDVAGLFAATVGTVKPRFQGLNIAQCYCDPAHDSDTNTVALKDDRLRFVSPPSAGLS
ncbi:hypothetical protein BC629DRAFT_1444847 [Irpex lacteus]|nr:hypothetical protein BC629DRAFT_1444847 [Irpex lacteus]